MRRSALLFGWAVLLAFGSASQAQGGRALMGVELDSAPLPELLTRHLGLDTGQGVRIRNVIVDSPADNAGLERDDIVASFQGEKVTAVEQIVEGVRGAGVGDEVSLEVIHLGQRKKLQLQLAAARENPELKYPPEPQAVTTWRPGKAFKIGPDGQEWIEIPFDRMPDFDVDVNRFLRERRTFVHKSDDGDYTITIEGDPADKDSTVIVETGEDEYRTTVGKLDAIPEQHREAVREATEDARKNARKDVIIERRLRLPEPPRPEMYQRFLRSVPRPDMDHLNEQKDRAIEKLQEQMERLQEQMKALEERNREMLDRLLDRKPQKQEAPAAPKKTEPAEPQDDRTI